jgi:16S rRNA (cytosine967-C5)-methyltransferase
MEPSRVRLEAATSALQSLLSFAGPADGALRDFFRDHRQLGQHDRAFVAELSFAVLRHLRLFEELGARRSPRRLALTALSITFGVSVRELSPLLRRDEEAFLVQLRSREPGELPPAVRLSLPDWLF